MSMVVPPNLSRIQISNQTSIASLITHQTVSNKTNMIPSASTRVTRPLTVCSCLRKRVAIIAVVNRDSQYHNSHSKAISKACNTCSSRWVSTHRRTRRTWASAPARTVLAALCRGRPTTDKANTRIVATAIKRSRRRGREARKVRLERQRPMGEGRQKKHQSRVSPTSDRRATMAK